jgi:hypothetical protein
MAQSDAGNEFDAAKAIVETLKKLDRPLQERAIRFASEALGLHAPSGTRTVGGGTQLQPVTMAASATVTGRPVDIKQFVSSKAPKSDQQFATVVAYYYRFEAPPEQRRDTINATVLADAARLVVRKRPTRFALTNAKNQGYLDSAGGGEYRINTVGENLVAITLPGNSSDTGNRRSKKQAKQRVKKKSKKRAKTS